MIFEKIRERLQDEKIIENPYESSFGELIHNKVLDYAIDIVNQVEDEYNNGWIPCSERLPEETGYYLCTVEWYGTSTKELLLNNGHIIEERILLVHFLDSTKTFKCCENYCTYKVTHWQPLPQPPLKLN